MQIEFVKNNKSLMESIIPHAIHNRFDIKYDDYQLLKLSEDTNIEYIPIKVFEYRINVGLYLRKPEVLTGGGLQVFVKFLFDKFPMVYEIYFLHTYLELPNILPKVHWHINLPESIINFDKDLHKKVRYNTKWYPKKIKESLGNYTIDIVSASDCPENIVQKYLSWKKDAFNFIWSDKPLNYLKTNGITHVYIMHSINEILAIGFICETEENCFLENFAYNKKYSLFSPGMVLYYFIISDLISKHKKKLFLLGGELDYKKRYNGIRTETYTGCIYRDEYKIKKIHRIAENINSYSFLNVKIKRKIASCIARILLYNKYYKLKLKEFVTV